MGLYDSIRNRAVGVVNRVALIHDVAAPMVSNALLAHHVLQQFNSPGQFWQVARVIERLFQQQTTEPTLPNEGVLKLNRLPPFEQLAAVSVALRVLGVTPLPGAAWDENLTTNHIGLAPAGLDPVMYESSYKAARQQLAKTCGRDFTLPSKSYEFPLDFSDFSSSGAIGTWAPAPGIYSPAWLDPRTLLAIAVRHLSANFKDHRNPLSDYIQRTILLNRLEFNEATFYRCNMLLAVHSMLYVRYVVLKTSGRDEVKNFRAVVDAAWAEAEALVGTKGLKIRLGDLCFSSAEAERFREERVPRSAINDLADLYFVAGEFVPFLAVMRAHSFDQLQDSLSIQSHQTDAKRGSYFFWSWFRGGRDDARVDEVSTNCIELMAYVQMSTLLLITRMQPETLQKQEEPQSAFPASEITYTAQLQAKLGLLIRSGLRIEEITSAARLGVLFPGYLVNAASKAGFSLKLAPAIIAVQLVALQARKLAAQDAASIPTREREEYRALAEAWADQIAEVRPLFDKFYNELRQQLGGGGSAQQQPAAENAPPPKALAPSVKPDAAQSQESTMALVDALDTLAQQALGLPMGLSVMRICDLVGRPMIAAAAAAGLQMGIPSSMVCTLLVTAEADRNLNFRRNALGEADIYDWQALADATKRDLAVIKQQHYAPFISAIAKHLNASAENRPATPAAVTPPATSSTESLPHAIWVEQLGNGQAATACPGCQADLKLPSNKRLNVTCPKCGQKFQVET